MATESKTYLIDVQSNLDKYASDANKAAEEVAKLTVENNALKNSDKATGDQIEKSNSKLRAAKKEYNLAKKAIDQTTLANKAQKGSYQELYQQWQAAQSQLKKMGGAYTTNEKGVRVLSQRYIEQKKAVADAKQSLNEFGKGVNDNRLNVGSYGEAIEGAFGNMSPMMSKAAGGVKMLSNAFKVLLANPVILVIAGIVAALSTMMAYFKRSEEGQNALSKVMKVFGSILDNIMDVVSAVGKAIFNMVTKPKEAIQQLGDLIKKNITNRIQALKDIAGAVGKIFSKDWKEGFKELGESTVQLFTGVDDLIGKVARGAKNFVNEIKDDVSAAKALADELAQIAKDERQYLVENAKIAGESAKLRADAELEKLVNAKASIALFEKSFDLDEKVLAQQLNIAKRKAANAAESARLANSDIETLDEVAKLESEVFAKQTQFDELRRQRTRRLNSIRREGLVQEQDRAIALLKILKAEEAANIQKNTAILADTQATLNEKEQASLDNLTIQQEIYRKESDLLVASLDAELELRLISQADYNVELQAIIAKRNSDIEKMEVTHQTNLNKIAKDAVKQAEADYKAKFERLRLQNEYDLDEQENILDQEYAIMLQSISFEQMTADERLLIDEKYTQSKMKLSEMRMDQIDRERQVVANALGAISDIIGAETAAGKAFAVAQATINTWVAASQVLRDPTIPSTVLKLAAMTSVIATGLATVKNILKVDTGGSTSAPSGSSVPTTISQSSTAQRALAQPTGPNILTQGNLSQTQLNALPQQGGITTENLVEALKAMKPPIVTVEDINARTAEKTKVEVRGTV